MYGSVGAWLYRYVAGVELNGLERIVIRPRMAFDWTLMKRMQAEVVTVMGAVAVAYERSGEGGSEVDMEVTVPLNTRAVVVMEPLVKGGACQSVVEGSTLLYESQAAVGGDGMRLRAVDGVTAASVDAVTGAVSFEVQGGSYRFTARWS